MTLAESMDARGHGHGTRSRYRPQPWDRRSIVSTGAALAAAGVFSVAAFAGAGGLHPSTFPLLWPEVSAGLLAAAGLLAVPGLLRKRGDT